MNLPNIMTQDPICGLDVDEMTSLHAERDGKTFSFCGRLCKDKFLAVPGDARLEKNPELAAGRAFKMW